MLEGWRAVEDGGTVAVMRYEVRVAGRMSELASSAFRGMTVAPVAPETIICGEVADDAHLHGLLERCQNMGLQVVSVREAPSVALATGGSSLDPRPCGCRESCHGL